MACDNYGIERELGPLKIDYFELYKCNLEGYEWICIILFVLWIVYLTSLLGNTAENYLSPTLGAICVKLKISYDLAGVTFLAFGNGSPDIFSSFTSFSGVGDALIGLGALIGGSVFISTIVVGAVCIFCPCDIPRGSFLRDISFHIIAVTCLAFIVIYRTVTLYVTIVLFIIYTSYASIVMWSSIRKKKKNSKKTYLGAEMTTRTTQLQTAFWHAAFTKPNHSKPSNTSTNSYSIIHNDPIDDHNNQIDGDDDENGYKFLILDEEGEGDLYSPPRLQSDDNTDDNDEDITINLSGLTSAQLNVPIIENYIDIASTIERHDIEEESKDIDDTLVNDNHQQKSFPERSESVSSRSKNLYDDDNTLSDSLLANNYDGESIAMDNFTSQKSKKYHRAIRSLYWNQLLLRRRLHRTVLTAEFWNYSVYHKLLTIIEFPATIARDFTVPTIDDEMWSKYYAIIQPITAPLFILFVTGYERDVVFGFLPAPIFAVIIGIVPSTIVMLLTHRTKPPSSQVFIAIWALFAFIMCVFWVYLLAGELVACLTAMGIIFNIPPATLGLTILAWGNCIGDFFSNTSIAKRGYGEMAIAGCYGGPVFNILIGLGLSLTYACIQNYPKAVKLDYDLSAVISLIFLYTSLISTLIIVWLRGFKIEKSLGYYLIGLYILYTVIQVFMFIEEV
jgi:sodium/potassium/calcium exchanger 6